MMNRERGIALIDLLIVVAFISILAAIFLPQMAAVAVRTENTIAVTDLRAAAAVQETLKANFGGYGRSEAAALPGSGYGAGAVLTGTGLPGTPNILTMTDLGGVPRGLEIQLSYGVTFIAKSDWMGETYTMAAKNQGGDKTFAMDAETKAVYMKIIPEPIGMDVSHADAIEPSWGVLDYDIVYGWFAM
jgi:type II secretory pathway pseudopilin PulG